MLLSQGQRTITTATGIAPDWTPLPVLPLTPETLETVGFNR